MIILKEYGFTPIQAEVFEDVLMNLIQPANKSLTRLDSRPKNQRRKSCYVVDEYTCEDALRKVDRDMSYSEIEDDMNTRFAACVKILDEIEAKKWQKIKNLVAKKEQEIKNLEAPQKRIFLNSEKYTCALDASKLQCECFERGKLEESVNLGYSHCKEIAKFQAEANQ